jgi:ADP-heptose:LPS heptosyltransferase
MENIPNAEWLITTVTGPMTFNRGTEETWFLNPLRKYVFNTSHVRKIAERVQTVSDLNGSPYYRPLHAGNQLAGRTVLVERFRDRGLGDLLFMTGPMAFMHQITGGDVRFHLYAFSDRGQVLLHSPGVEHVLVGPTHYADFQAYDYQWLVNSVTESNCDGDQLNVYDALYKQIGIDPGRIPVRFKRPYVTVDPKDVEAVYAFFHQVYLDRQFDLRHGYYVLAPLTHSPLRTAPYALWLDLAEALAQRRPLIVIGNIRMPLPDMDMPAGEFVGKISTHHNPRVLSFLPEPPSLRFITALIAQATGLIGLDSGPLYLAQAVRTPAVSLWGPHDPAVRIGYDRDYMELAIWSSPFCPNAPCYAFGRFPVHLCPEGHAQKICQVLRAVSPDHVLEKVDQMEERQVRALFDGQTKRPTHETAQIA